MTVRPFRLIGDTALAQLQQRLAQQLAAWEQAWGATLPAAAIKVSRLERQALEWDKAHWRQVELAAEGSAWLRLPEGLNRHVYQLLFGEDRHASLQDRHRESAMAIELAERAADALLRSLVAALGQGWQMSSVAGQAAALPTTATTPGAGAVVIEWPLSGKPLQLVAEGLRNAPVAARSRPALKGLKRSLSPVRFPAQVVLGEVELTIGQLETLGIGDVIRLDAKLDQSQTVVGPAGTALFQGHIGSQHGHRAIEVIK